RGLHSLPTRRSSDLLDEDGDTLIWGETDGEIGEDKRRYAWVDGEAKELDIERYDHFASLLPSGIIFNTVWDHDKEEEKYSIVERSEEHTSELQSRFD